MKPTSLPPSTLLTGCELFDGRDDAHPLVPRIDGTTIALAVRIVPARHLLTPLTGYLDLREAGKEPELLQLTLRDAAGHEVDAAFIDLLDDTAPAYALLLEAADRLNFTRAISQAERQIAINGALKPLKEKIATSLVAPLETAFRSLTSSVITQLSSASPEKKP